MKYLTEEEVVDYALNKENRLVIELAYALGGESCVRNYVDKNIVDEIVTINEGLPSQVDLYGIKS